MTSTQIRQSFLDFFKSKQHTIVPSSSLMPDSPNLLFTNAGMNQFVPIFLGQTQCPYAPGRAADTQKCIRAGGKHNDLDDVGLDTYHHTFFEMLGNWSFGDYFKREAIDWAWELVVGIWKFPPQRLYATVFCPYLGQPGWEKKWAIELEQVLALTMTSPGFIAANPSASPFEIADQEAAMYWAKKFTATGCDPKIHIVPGNRKDNFWMMGDTGPCGPCSELHVDLTPAGDTEGALVNQGDARCIEIWNLVFIQFNANTDGTFASLPAKHVDTGMGFERVTSIIQGTKNLTDFANAKISNYETDIFRPIFDELEKLSGKKYGSTLPSDAIAKTGSEEPLKTSGEGRGNIIDVEAAERGAHSSSPCDDEDGSDITKPTAEQIQLDIAFRVIADHIRTLSFAIADGIQPGIKGRNGVLRSIHKRMARYASTIGIKDEVLLKSQDALADTLANTMGDVFPELRSQSKHIKEVLRQEADVFNKTLARGIMMFEETASLASNDIDLVTIPNSNQMVAASISKVIPGEIAFQLYDTYGFPLDLTELMARERGLTVDKEGFNRLMNEQKKRSQAAQKKEVISLSQLETTTPTKFVGFDNLAVEAKVLEVVSLKAGAGVQASACPPNSLKAGLQLAVILDASVCYAEMGGQVGDTGELTGSGQLWHITNTQKSGNTWLHFIETERRLQAAELPDKSGVPQSEDIPLVGALVRLAVDSARRNAIQRHHTVTHLLHWALHEIASKEASQKGSFVGPDKLTFDFNSAPLTPAQVADIEKLVNERILENTGVSWTEVPHADVKSRKDVMQFFGDKYGDNVRVVQIGGHAGKLDGYSMELCGGTHVRATGEIGLFRIIGESAIAAGVRRIEAVAGLEAYRKANEEAHLIKTLAGRVNSPVHELDKKIELLLAHQKELEREVRTAMMRNASNAASELLGRAQTVNDIPLIAHNLGEAEPEFLQAIADALKGRFQGVIVLGGHKVGAVTLICAVTPEFTTKVQAGKIIQTIAPMVGGKGGGKPDNARGGGKDVSKLDEALAKAKTLLG